jgi:hypothetical protein
MHTQMIKGVYFLITTECAHFTYLPTALLEIPMFHQFLTSKFDDFVFVRLGAGSDEIMDESFLFFRCGEVDKLNDWFQYVHFFCHLFRQVCCGSASSVIVGRGEVAIWAGIFN